MECGYQLYLSSTIILSTHVQFGALSHVCFSGYFCNLSLADTVSPVKSAEGQIICLFLSGSLYLLIYVMSKSNMIYQMFCKVIKEVPLARMLDVMIVALTSTVRAVRHETVET